MQTPSTSDTVPDPLFDIFEQPPSTTGSRHIPSNNDPDVIRILIMSDTHDGRYDPRTLPAADLLMHAGDMSMQPGYSHKSTDPDVIEEQVQRYIANFKYLKSLPYNVKLANEGNHGQFSEEALEFQHPAPPSHGRSVGAARQRLTDAQKTQIREACQTNEDEGWHFVQHGPVTVTVKGHPFRAFLTSMSISRGTDGYNFDRSDKAGESALWKDVPLDLDAIMSHGPMLDLLSKCKPGQQLFDRDGIVPGVRGSEGLAEAAETSTPGLVVTGHMHGPYGDREVEWRNGSKGRIINAAAVLTGDIPGDSDMTGERSEYLTPRDPYLIDYNTKTKESTVVYKWDGRIRGETVELPPHARPIIRMDPTEYPDKSDLEDKRENETWEDADTRLMDATRKVQYSLTQEGKDAWLAKVAEDHTAYKSWLTQFDKYYKALTLQGTTLFSV